MKRGRQNEHHQQQSGKGETAEFLMLLDKIGRTVWLFQSFIGRWQLIKNLGLTESFLEKYVAINKCASEFFFAMMWKSKWPSCQEDWMTNCFSVAQSCHDVIAQSLLKIDEELTAIYSVSKGEIAESVKAICLEIQSNHIASGDGRFDVNWLASLRILPPT